MDRRWFPRLVIAGLAVMILLGVAAPPVVATLPAVVSKASRRTRGMIRAPGRTTPETTMVMTILMTTEMTEPAVAVDE